MSELPITATVAQFRKISGLGKTSIYHLLKVGDLQSRVICGRRLILISSWMALLDRSSQPAKGRRRSRSNRGYDRGHKSESVEKMAESRESVAEGMSAKQGFAWVHCRSESKGRGYGIGRPRVPAFANVRV